MVCPDVLKVHQNIKGHMIQQMHFRDDQPMQFGLVRRYASTDMVEVGALERQLVDMWSLLCSQVRRIGLNDILPLGKATPYMLWTTISHQKKKQDQVSP